MVCGGDIRICGAGRQGGGHFHSRANQSGLGAHVANAAFMVSPDARGFGSAKAWGCIAWRRHGRLDFARCNSTSWFRQTDPAVRLQTTGISHHSPETLPGAFHHARLGDVDAYVMFRELDLKVKFPLFVKRVAERAPILLNAPFRQGFLWFSGANDKMGIETPGSILRHPSVIFSITQTHGNHFVLGGFAIGYLQIPFFAVLVIDQRTLPEGSRFDFCPSRRPAACHVLRRVCRRTVCHRTRQGRKHCQH